MAGNCSLLLGFILVLGLFFGVSPVSGKYIDYGYSQSFDAAALTNPPFGEEINVKLWIAAVDNEIQDISIIFSESGAFIDEGSFSYTLDSPYQQTVPADIRRTGKVWSIAKLKRGEKVTITFNAYPKTIRMDKLEIGSVVIGYAPVLENNQKSNTITEDRYPLVADMKDSVWFEFDKLQTEQKNKAYIPYFNQALIGITVVASIIAFIFFITWLRTRSHLNKEILQTKGAWKADLIQLRDKLRGASESDIPQILSTIDEWLISDKMLAVETKEASEKRPDSGKKNRNKGDSGGF
jgi:hypothetical protein